MGDEDESSSFRAALPPITTTQGLRRRARTSSSVSTLSVPGCNEGHSRDVWHLDSARRMSMCGGREVSSSSGERSRLIIYIKVILTATQ